MAVAATLDEWQKAGDAHVFKLIVSPEFGERMDLKAHTHGLMQRMAEDLGTPLQWVAIEHHNTNHPHVHVAVRGRDAAGQPLRIGRAYIQRGLRNRAQELATVQLGYRTHDDIRLAADRQVVQQRFTDIDRALQRAGKPKAGVLRVDYPTDPPLSSAQRERRLREMRRLQQLVTMGLATKTGPLSWEISESFESVLRQMQIGADRLKSLHQQRVTVSDARLPLVHTQTRDIRYLAGRVIGSGLEEHTGVPYLFLEAVDENVHYLCHDAAIDEARQAGQLRSGSFVALARRLDRGEDGRKRARIVITNLGDAEALVKNEEHLKAEAIRRARGQGQLPQAGSMGGWLGRYQKAVAEQAQRLVAAGQLHKGTQGFEIRNAHGRSQAGR